MSTTFYTLLQKSDKKSLHAHSKIFVDREVSEIWSSIIFLELVAGVVSSQGDVFLSNHMIIQCFCPQHFYFESVENLQLMWIGKKITSYLSSINVDWKNITSYLLLSLQVQLLVKPTRCHNNLARNLLTIMNLRRSWESKLKVV